MREKKIEIEKLKLKDVFDSFAKLGKDKGKVKRPLNLIKISEHPNLQARQV